MAQTFGMTQEEICVVEAEVKRRWATRSPGVVHDCNCGVENGAHAPDCARELALEGAYDYLWEQVCDEMLA